MTQQQRKRYESYLRPIGDGLMLKGQVSPCVFIYEGYPLQIEVALCRLSGEPLGIGFAADRTKTAHTYTDADVERLLDSVRIAACSRCGTPAFDPEAIQTNRTGLCEAYFLDEFNAQAALDEAAERLALIESDTRARKAGMKFRVSAWIHPKVGDDYQKDWYLASEPEATDIKAILRGVGSSVPDDYTVIKL